MNSSKKERNPSIVGMIVSPVETLKRIRQRPIFWRAALTLCVVSLVLFGIIHYYQLNDPKFLEIMLQQMPQEFQTLSKSEQHMAIESVKRTNLIMGIMMGGIATFLIPFMGAVFLKLVFILLKHRKVPFKQLYSFQVYLYTISVLAIFVQAITTVIANGSLQFSPTSLAGILPISNGLGKAILLGFDLFNIWSLILLKHGLVEVARLPSGKSWLVTVVFFLFIVGMHISNYLITA